MTNERRHGPTSKAEAERAEAKAAETGVLISAYVIKTTLALDEVVGRERLLGEDPLKNLQAPVITAELTKRVPLLTGPQFIEVSGTLARFTEFMQRITPSLPIQIGHAGALMGLRDAVSLRQGAEQQAARRLPGPAGGMKVV